MAVSKTARGSSNLSRGANQRNGGRVAQCTGLQISKAVGSNPTRCSKTPGGETGKRTLLKRERVRVQVPPGAPD